jgi:hypothetical protein
MIFYRNKLQNATVIRQAMFKGELKESKALSYQRMPVIRELDNKSFETGHYRKFAWQTETDLNSINRWLKDRGEEGHPTFWNPPEFVTLNYVNWPTGC